VAKISDLSDDSTFGDDGFYGLTTRQITGVRVVLEWCARAILSPRGVLVWQRQKGEDVRDLENSDLRVAEIEARRQGYDAAIREVDFVRSVASRLIVREPVVRYEARITVDGEGTFPLAVTLQQAGTAIAEFGQ
jgi:hypothetical protein